MQTVVEFQGGARASSNALPKFTADDLARLSLAELRELYEGGRLFDLDRLRGAPKGRMLTLAGGLGKPTPRRVLARLAKGALFPWRGKSFRTLDQANQRGAGINRVILLGDRFPFDTFIEASAIDGKPCVRLDYDKPENPFFIRVIRDELREVAEDLYLGPAMFDGKRPELVLWFAIDCR
ncbi:MAG: hypothetical protein KC492_28475 [Myxococcales bacterium]|nr:hypothetical protein [Myxococcales bacterium]